jgi:hypothetical protein
MKRKTISELNEKAWYRLTKVLYLIAFAIIFLAYNILLFTDGVRQLDRNKTMVICNSIGNKTFSLSETALYFGNHEFDNYDYRSFLTSSSNEYSIKSILAKCAGANESKINVLDYQRIIDLERKNPDLSNDAFAALFNDQKKNDPSNALLDYSNHLFDINPKYTYFPFIEGLFVGNIIIILAFFFFQRIFYYVILGKIFPVKKNEGNNPG